MGEVGPARPAFHPRAMEEPVQRRSSMLPSRRHGSVVDEAADADLAKMGYRSDLPRSLSMLSVLGMSFAIMAGMLEGLLRGRDGEYSFNWSSGSAVRVVDNAVHHLDRRAECHDHLGLGLRLAHLAQYCCVFGGDLRRLSHCWRRILLVGDDVSVTTSINETFMFPTVCWAGD